MNQSSVLIKGVRLYGEGDPVDVLVTDGQIAEIGTGLVADLDLVEVIDAEGQVLLPGFVDLHTHLREPGKEEAETIESGSNAAALGGYTAVLAMPNTTPTMDCAAVVQQVLDLGRDAPCDVYASGAITVDRAGEQLAPMAEMAALGVRLFTDDGAGVQSNAMMRRAMEYAVGLGVTLAQHCEDDAMANGGHMHEGEWSARLGIAGQPSETEELMVMRDIALARMTGARVHFLHLSTAGSVAMVAAAWAEVSGSSTANSSQPKRESRSSCERTLRRRLATAMISASPAA